MITKQDITNAKILAMKAKDSFRNQTVSSILAAIKQQEVDTHNETTPDSIITILNRMVKQRQESITQFTAGSRQDLVEIEQKELDIIKEFLPKQATAKEIEAVIEKCINIIKIDEPELNQRSMGKIMGLVKIELNGKTDMSKVSQLVKNKLS